MLLSDSGFELVGYLERQKDVGSLLDSFQRVVVSFGMRAYCVGDPASAKSKRKHGRWAGTWPENIYRIYESQNLISTDPTVARMNAGASPFRWSSTYARASSVEKRTLDQVRDMCGRDGFAVPIHGPKGSIAGVSIGTGAYELSRQDEMALHMASLYLHARLIALTDQADRTTARALTPRERECLEWVAAGKTDWEISQILNISEQTAHGYVQNALTKLNARTRAQAVALAIQSAQISP